MAMKLWPMLHKFGPFAVLAGYLVMYQTQKSNGVMQILPDLQAVTVSKITSSWQNLAIAGIAGAGLFVMNKIKMPGAFKTLATIGLYFVIGWELADVFDPPGPGIASASQRAQFVSPKALNPYTLTG